VAAHRDDRETAVKSNSRIPVDTLALAENHIMEEFSRKRQRQEGPDWNSFYKNGLPKEVIVIDDSPEPDLSLMTKTNAAQRTYGLQWDAKSRNHTQKKRKRGEAAPPYDPIYHLEQTPSASDDKRYNGPNSASASNSGSSTSGVITTAATSLGSQYSHNGTNGANGNDSAFGIGGVGQKRKRNPLQDLNHEARAKKSEVNDPIDTFYTYRTPPRPPIKAGDVKVKSMPDVCRPSFRKPSC
jgi:dual-specificity kinase